MAFEKYPRPAVAVDIAVFRTRNNGLEILLIQRGQDPFRGDYALPGGFVNIEEGLAEAAARELQEETNITDIVLHQIRAFGTPDRDPRGRVISIVYAGMLPPGLDPPLRAGDDAAQADWFAVDHLPDLAFDHGEIIRCTQAWLREENQ